MLHVPQSFAVSALASIRSGSRQGRLRRAAHLFPALIALTTLGGVALTGCTGNSASSPTNGTNTNSGGTNNPVAGKAAISLTFSNPSGTNANTSAFQATQAQGGLGLGAGGLNNLTIGGSSQTGSTLRVITINVLSNGTAQAGKSYPVSDTSGNDFSVVSLSQTTIQGVTPGTPAVWSASSGSVVVDSITGKTYKVHLTDVVMTVGDGNDSSSTGSFTLNGTAEVTVP